MKYYLQLLLCVCLITATSCHTGRKVVRSYRPGPKFIDDVYIDGHNRKNYTREGIDKATANAEVTPAPRKTTGTSKKTYNDIDLKPREIRALKEKYAGLLGVDKRDIEHVALYSFIDDWYGTSYHLGGLKRTGIDCSGFAKRLYEAVFSTELIHSSKEQYNNCKWVKKGEVVEGDLVFFTTKGKHISHVGVYLMNNYFVHASTSQGVIISSLKEEYWQKHLAGAGRMK